MSEPGLCCDINYCLYNAVRVVMIDFISCTGATCSTYFNNLWTFMIMPYVTISDILARMLSLGPSSLLYTYLCLHKCIVLQNS